MAKNKIDITSSIGKRDKLLDAGKGAVLTQDLGSLLSGNKKGSSNKTSIDVKKIIDNPFQPRLEIKEDALLELAESIKSEGQLQPIVVQKYDDKYIVIAGHRRLYAHKLIDKKAILATIVDEPYSDTVENNKLLFRQATIENIQRENLYPLEFALACREAIDKGLYKSVSAISLAINKTPAYLSKVMSVLKLSERVIQDLSDTKSVKDLESLYELQKIKDEELQYKLYTQFKNKEINRDDIRLSIKAQNKPSQSSPFKYKASDKKIALNIDLTRLDSEKASALQIKIKNLIEEYA